MYKKMLVPLDGSKLAEIVLDYAQQIARRLDLNLILLHVCAKEESDYVPMHRGYIEQAAEVQLNGSDDAQERTGHSATMVARARGELVVGQAADEILRYAEENEIDLILMATHGRSGQVGLWPMGSVVHRVISTSPVPIWLVPTRIPPEIIYDEWPTRKMLVPLDGSTLAETVLPRVTALIRQHGVRPIEVTLVTVCETPFIGSDTLDALMPADWRKRLQPEMIERQREAEQYLNRVASQLGSASLKVRSEVLMGEPANEIIVYTNRNPFNLVAMSTHGYTGNMRWAYGSVAHKVLNGITSPVFLVRPKNNS